MNERARIISKDGVQYVELPSGLRLGEGEWTARRDGEAVVLEPFRQAGGSASALMELLAGWKPLDEVISDIEDPLPDAVDWTLAENDEDLEGSHREAL